MVDKYVKEIDKHVHDKETEVMASVLKAKGESMCGIVGYLGSGSAVPVLVSGLRSLEYRGYDSAGLAVIEDGAFACDESSRQVV